MIKCEFINSIIKSMEFSRSDNKNASTDFIVDFDITPSGLKSRRHIETCRLCYDNTGVHALWFSDWYEDYDLTCCYFKINGIYNTEFLVRFYNDCYNSVLSNIKGITGRKE